MGRGVRICKAFTGNYYWIFFFMLQILFSNMEDILDVHNDFLTALEYCLHPEPHSQHELGEVFLKFVSIIH